MSRKIEGKPTIEADFFGSVRFIDLMKDRHKDNDEIFFSIEKRDPDGNYKPSKDYGYIKKTEEMENFIKHEFFTGCNGIQFIQWSDRFNVVFDEAQIIGGISFDMSFGEFRKLFPDVKLELTKTK